MNTPAFNQHSFASTYPQSIDELNTPQWIHYLMLLANLQSGEIDITEFKNEWLSYLLGLDKVHFEGDEKAILLAENQHVLTNFLVSIHGDIQPDTFSLKNKLNQYTWKDSIFRGPQDLCFDLSFGTFLKCSFVYKDYLHTHNPKALRYLFAVLYSDGSPLTERIEKLSDMPINVALSAFYFFESVLSHLSTNRISFQGEELPLYELFKTENHFDLAGIGGIEAHLFDLAAAHCDNECTSNLREKNFYEVMRFTWFKMKRIEA